MTRKNRKSKQIFDVVTSGAEQFLSWGRYYCGFINGCDYGVIGIKDLSISELGVLTKIWVDNKDFLIASYAEKWGKGQKPFGYFLERFSTVSEAIVKYERQEELREQKRLDAEQAAFDAEMAKVEAEMAEEKVSGISNIDYVEDDEDDDG